MKNSRITLIADLATLTNSLTSGHANVTVENHMAKIFSQIAVVASDENLNLKYIENTAQKIYTDEYKSRRDHAVQKTNSKTKRSKTKKANIKEDKK